MGRLRKRKRERTEGEAERKRKRVEERQKRKTILHISAVRPLAWLTIEKPVYRTDGKSRSRGTWGPGRLETSSSLE